MSAVGPAVIALIIFCAAIGAVASIRNPDDGLGKEFLEGLHAIGHIFIPVGWIMAMMVGYMAGATIMFSIPVDSECVPITNLPARKLSVLNQFP